MSDLLRNERLQLRAVEPEDVDLLYQWENDMALWPVSSTLKPFSRAQLARYVKNAALDVYQTRQLRLMIDWLEGSHTVGMVDLFDFDPYHRRAGVGIMLHADWRGKGVAAAALDLFCPYAFQVLGLHQLYCNIAEGNKASRALFEAAGFQLVGKKRDWLKTPEGFEEEWLYQLIRPASH